ncbi:MAG TPA: CbtB-domain containing protein [Conexibacter sp.]|nr:CbtB-domain containing protein [Conexibacter sp.]
MSDASIERAPSIAPLPIASAGELLPYALFVGLLMMVLIYFVGAEEGALSVFSGSYVHEFVHDARHLLGFPCH